MLELVIATKNKKKLVEIKDILNVRGIKITSLEEYPHAPRIVENGRTFKDNALKKAVQIARFTGKLALGEDSGLCVRALGGKPGVYSSRFCGKDKSDDKNNAKLLRLMQNVPENKRGAYYVCAVAIADKNGKVGVAEGRCSGRIGYELKGSRGFGYDPLFVIPKFKLTFAQLGEKIKHGMSHRYYALEKAKKVILKYIERRLIS
ncbi:MAG: RdgB/HAM1 family non-canonical purine NTP pyrophosphatase [Candidatus Omnitrophota bacterium]|nr:RdgB/HAM1 family non-canonical purine NTP pyrophosphatase [Candidatus Omnitrophota bacterium]